MRYAIFKENLDLIEQHNQDFLNGKYTYRLGVNEYADWTFEEFKDIFLGTRYNLSTNKQGSSGRFLRLPPHVQIPDRIDWRDLGAVTEVKNQGQCGSCWAFSSTGSLEAAHFRLTGKLVSLSEQQLVDCSNNYSNKGCNGGWMDNAFQYIKAVGGIDTEDSYPYHGHNEKCHFNKNQIGSTCSGYVDLEPGNENALKEAVATVGPVSVAIDVTEKKFMLYKDGVFFDSTCSNKSESLNHGVLVVGYGADILSQKAVKYWSVKNSWGKTWGESGFIRMARDNENMCGISSLPVYPIVHSKE